MHDRRSYAVSVHCLAGLMDQCVFLFYAGSIWKLALLGTHGTPVPDGTMDAVGRYGKYL